MANSLKIKASTSASPVGTTAVAAGTALPDNCYLIIIQNTGANTLLISDSGVAAGVTLTSGTNANPLAAGATMSIPCGTLSERGPGQDMVYAASGGATTAVVTYLCRFGP